jgi:hypothetical protein
MPGRTSTGDAYPFQTRGSRHRRRFIARLNSVMLSEQPLIATGDGLGRWTLETVLPTMFCPDYTVDFDHA